MRENHGRRSNKEALDEMERVNGYCYLGNRWSASVGCEMAVATRHKQGVKRRGREKFRECNQLLRGKISSLKMKGSI